MAATARTVTALAAIAAATIAVSGCGGERSFDAEGFVAELNEAGASISLGAELPSLVDGSEVRVIELGARPEHSEDVGHGHDHGTDGAVVILSGREEAEAEFDRCQSAPAFTCFRAANAVLRFSGLAPEDRAMIVASLKQIETNSES